jgi:hypothetical protein
VGNGEGGGPEARLLEDGGVVRLGELGVELGSEGWVGAGGKARLFVEEGEDAELALDQVDTGLVVAKVDEGPVNLLGDVFLLLELEDVRVKLCGAS